MLTELAFFVALLLLAHQLIKWIQRKRTLLKTFTEQSIPGPVPSFLTGNFRDFLRDDLKHETLDQWSKKYGSYYGYYQGEKPFLVLTDIEDVQEVIVKQGRSFPNRQRSNVNVEPFLSSLLGLRGEQWRNSRRVLTPPFTAHKMTLNTTTCAINDSVARLMLALEQQRRNTVDDTVDVLRCMQSVTLDVISRLAFNMTDNDDLYEDDSKLRTLTTNFMENGAANRITQLIAYFPFLERLAIFAYNIFGGGQLLDHLSEHLNKCVLEYYQKRIQDRFSPGANEAATNKDKKNRKVNILDFMLEQQEEGNLSEMALLGNALTILIAGYETTATALTFTLYLLAKHQDIQTRLRKEIVAKHAEVGNFCYFDLDRCELLDRVWYESMRLYPPIVTFLTRELDDKLEQLQLSKSNIRITKNMTVQVPTWTMHHDSKYWPEPNLFDPMRENLPIPGSTKTNCAFLPFGNGPRNCIGSNLANSEGRAVLTALLRRYKVDFAQKEDPDTIDPQTGLLKLTCKTVIIHPKKRILLRLTPITDL